VRRSQITRRGEEGGNDNAIVMTTANDSIPESGSRDEPPPPLRPISDYRWLLRVIICRNACPRDTYSRGLIKRAGIIAASEPRFAEATLDVDRRHGDTISRTLFVIIGCARAAPCCSAVAVKFL